MQTKQSTHPKNHGSPLLILRRGASESASQKATLGTGKCRS